MDKRKLENLLYAGVVDVRADQVRHALQIWKDIKDDLGEPNGNLFDIFPEGPYYHAMVDSAPYNNDMKDRFPTLEEFEMEQARVFRAFADFGAKVSCHEHELDDTGIKLRTVDIAWINMFDMNPEDEFHADGSPVRGNVDASAEVIMQHLYEDPKYVPDFSKSFLQLRLTPQQSDIDQRVEAAYRYMESVRDHVALRMRTYQDDDLTARFASDFVEYKALDNLYKWTSGSWDVREKKPWILPKSYLRYQEAEMEMLRQIRAEDRGEGLGEDLRRAAQNLRGAERAMASDVLFSRLERGDMAASTPKALDKKGGPA